MNTALLLCAALLAVDNPAQVQAKVLYGAGADQQHRADIDLWISQAVAKTGSPLAQPYTDWLALTEDVQQLYATMQGGRIVRAKAALRDGKYEVEISGFKISPLQQTVVLAPGERRVVKLNDYPVPNNVFLALAAPISKQARDRVAALKANAKSFRLELDYNSQLGIGEFRLIVSVPEIDKDRGSWFQRIVQIQEDEANALIDQLARDGFLDNAIDLRMAKKKGIEEMPGYTLKVTAGQSEFYEDLGWHKSMVPRLDSLRNFLPEPSRKDYDFVLERMADLRVQWEAEQSGLEAKAGRADTRIRLTSEEDTAIVDITSTSGIDKATISRRTSAWPGSLLVRLHLGGLESFQASGKDATIEWTVSSTDELKTTTSLVSGKRVAILTQESPYYTRVRIVGGQGKLPLRDGHFEVPLPARLFEGNPAEIKLSWIDFYRQ